MSTKREIPTYSLEKFKNVSNKNTPYQVEIFDANRHFQVQYPHRHDFFEVLFLTQGSGYHIIDDNKYVIEPPCIFFLSPGQAHKLELSKDIAGYIFLFTAEFYLLNKSNKNRLLELPFFFNVNQQNEPLKIVDHELDLFIELFQKGCTLMNEDGVQYDMMNSLLDLILNLANHLYPRAWKAEEGATGHIMVKRFRLLIEEKYQDNLSVNEYAELLNVTPNHLTQTVKSILARTSNDLIKDRVILEIKRLLRHTDLSATEIADQMSFSDQSYFTKFFKKSTGITPNQYRIESLKST